MIRYGSSSFFFVVLLLFVNGTATQKSLENIPNYKLKTVHSFILKHIPWCNLKPDPFLCHVRQCIV